MLRLKLLFLITCLPPLTASRTAQARFYWDGNPVFSSLETWELIVFGLIILTLAAAFLFILVHLITHFFGKK